ncbi:GSCOCG00007221001-RA-CDS, partial [Cotesia congregata]
VTIPRRLFSDLHWWEEKVRLGCSKIKRGEYVKTIFTDASDSGWGATDGTNNIYGFWNEIQTTWHINYKELYVVKLALESLASELSDSQILLRVDNTTAIAYVNKMGGTRLQRFNELTKEIWQWAEARRNFLFASYIPSEENTEADSLSRLSNDDAEWELADFAFKMIISRFELPDVDLFATKLNKTCACFCSRFPDAEAMEIDAFTISWSKFSKSFRIDGRKIIRAAFLQKGSPGESIDVILASLSDSSIKQYESALQQWSDFCGANKLKILEPDSEKLLRFLSIKQKEGASYSALNTLRSAVSLIAREKIGEDPLVSRFMKGAFKLKPATPKYGTTWDVSLVLTYLEKLVLLDKLSIAQLTLKTVTLLALCTAHRVQTLASIEIKNIVTKENALEIKIPKLVKTSGPRRLQPLLVIPFFVEKPGLCVASTLKAYIEASKKARGKLPNLFISVKRPFKAVSSQTISRWIKVVLSDSGVDTAIFSGHSTRHAATSAAFIKGVNLDTIRMTAGWSKESGMFAKVYNRPITSDNQIFAKAILGINN